MAEKGKPLNPYSMAFAQGVAVAETDVSRRNATSCRTPTTSTIAVCTSLRIRRDAPGYRSLNSIRAAMKAWLPAALKPHYKWKDSIDQGIIIAGSPKTVRDRLREAMTSLNRGHLITGSTWARCRQNWCARASDSSRAR